VNQVFHFLAPAKINFCLFVLFERPDGFHEIESILQTVSLYDEVMITLKDRGVEVSSEPSIEVPMEENLAYLAAQYFFEATALEGGCSVKLIKNIPPASGLGGGSSDAATVLLLLNKAFNYPLKPSELSDLGALVGSDVPFFLVQGTALVKGKGERVYPLTFNLTAHLVLVKPPMRLSTALVYKSLDPGALSQKNTWLLLRSLNERDYELLSKSLSNDLEPVAAKLVPEIATLKDLMVQAGAMGALVSGSGPTVFGIFPDSKRAEKAARFFESMGYWSRHVWSTPPLR